MQISEFNFASDDKLSQNLYLLNEKYINIVKNSKNININKIMNMLKFLTKFKILCKTKTHISMRFWLVYKPSSVIEGNHQSRCNIAIALMRSRERASNPNVPHLAPHGVCSELLSPTFRVGSYPTFSPLPH